MLERYREVSWFCEIRSMTILRIYTPVCTFAAVFRLLIRLQYLARTSSGRWSCGFIVSSLDLYRYHRTMPCALPSFCVWLKIHPTSSSRLSTLSALTLIHRGTGLPEYRPCVLIRSSVSWSLFIVVVSSFLWMLLPIFWWRLVFCLRWSSCWRKVPRLPSRLILCSGRRSRRWTAFAAGL